MKKILIFSAGPAGREVNQLINSINKVEKKWEVLGFVDDNLEKKNKKIDNLKVYSTKSKPLGDKINAVSGIMDPNIREKIYLNEILKNDYEIPNLIHPSIEIPSCLKIGKGNILFANIHLSFEVSIGNFSVISNFCDVGHNLNSDDFLTMMPSVVVGGNCKIGKKVLLGSGSKVLQNIHIGEKCRVGIGSNLTNNLPSNTTIIDYQRKVTKKNVE